MLEIVVVLGLAATLAAVSVAPMLAGRNALRAAAAGRYLASVAQAARMSAIQRGLDVGLRFEHGPDGWAWSVFADGNGNGLRSADIAAGIDPCLSSRTAVSAMFPGVDVGSTAGLPQVDSTSLVGDDPVRLGSSNILSFSADGTSSSGTVYLVGRGGHAWAVRVLGATARIRLSRFDAARHLWVEP